MPMAFLTDLRKGRIRFQNRIFWNLPHDASPNGYLQSLHVVCSAFQFRNVHKETDKVQRIKKITFARAIRIREYREGGKVHDLQSVNALEVGDLQSANGFIAHGYTLYKYTGLTGLHGLIIQMLPKL